MPVVTRSTVQLADNTSETESNEIDIDLIADTIDTIDTIDTLSDITDKKDADITDDIAGSRPGTPDANDIYKFIEQRLLSLDPLTTMALGMLEYHETFYPHYIAPEKEGNFGKTLYRTSPPSLSEEIEADELGLVFFGEICSSFYGTAISAKGNHYVGNPENPKPITDTSIVKDIIILRPLAIAPSESLVDLAFKNQCAGLEEILDQDAKDRSLHPDTDSIDITEFLVSSDPEGHRNDRSFIKVTLPPKYRVPTNFKSNMNKSVFTKPPSNKKTDIFQLLRSEKRKSNLDEPDSEPGPSTSVQDAIINLEVGALYDPNLLPDYRGDLFQHKFAKVVQQDVKDTDDNLVAPWDMHEKLRPGTIIVVDTTLVCWHIAGKGASKSRRVYQVQAHRIQILHESKEPAEELIIPTLPRKMVQKQLSYETSPRKTASPAFNAFGSPFKKPRRM